MSKDDMETATMNVMFDGSEEKDDEDDNYYSTLNSIRDNTDVPRKTMGDFRRYIFDHFNKCK